MSPDQREKLIVAIIDCRIQNIRNNSDEERWIADVMNFGWTGFDKHSDADLLEVAGLFGWSHLGLEEKDFK